MVKKQNATAKNVTVIILSRWNRYKSTQTPKTDRETDRHITL